MLMNDLHITEIGAGQVIHTEESYRLTVPPADKDTYHDAQISTYTSAQDFRHRPALKMTIRAYAEGEIHGTAGFGFWSHPYTPNEFNFRLPKAVWFFFGSPPNTMALAKGVPGHGWKAATFDASRWQFLALLPAAPVGFLLMRNPALYRRLWPIGQRAVGVSEKALDTALLYEPHDYTLEWRKDGVRFSLDGGVIHETDLSPAGPLGFIAWVDNQYAIVTPQGQFGFGVVAVPHEQSLVIERLSIETL